MTIALSKSQLLEILLREDFYSFVRQVFATLHPGQVYEEAWHVEVICVALTRFLEGDDLNFVLNTPPRSLKSLICSIALPAYLLGKFPSQRIICASYGLSLAETFARDTRTVMESDWYRQLFRHTRLARMSEEGLFTTAGGYRRTVSVGSSVTGFGGDLIIVDDPIKSDDIHSAPRRETTKNWFIRTLPSRRNDMRSSKTILVMQRLHIDDPCALILSRPRTTHLRLPAEADRDYEFELRNGNVKRWEEEEPLQGRQPSRALLQERKELGASDYVAQYMQAPLPLEGGMLKWAWFGRYDTPPAFKAGDLRIFSWDTAFTDSTGADYSACVELLARGQTLYVLHILRERLRYPDLKRIIAEQRHRAPGGAILVEHQGAGISVAQDLMRDGIGVIKRPTGGSKEMRASIASTPIEAGEVLLPQQAPWLGEFQSEILAFPQGRHDDQVDALTQAIIWRKERLARRTTTLFGTW